MHTNILKFNVIVIGLMLSKPCTLCVILCNCVVNWLGIFAARVDPSCHYAMFSHEFSASFFFFFILLFMLIYVCCIYLYFFFFYLTVNKVNYFLINSTVIS